MASDPRENGPRPEGHGSPDDSGEGTSRWANRLPPPAFPPGLRRVHVHRSKESSAEAGGLGEALISPDEPLPAREPGVEDRAFISPDEPIPHREPVSTAVSDDAFISPDEPIPHREPGNLHVGSFTEADVVVTGIGDDPHLSEEDMALGHYGDPDVKDLVDMVTRLADSLRKKGEAGLRTSADMSRFEITLRAYCVGYLAGRREEEA